MVSAPPVSGDATLLLLLARLIIAGLVLAVVLVLTGLAGFVLARLVFAGLALATVFVAGEAFLLFLAGALADILGVVADSFLVGWLQCRSSTGHTRLSFSVSRPRGSSCSQEAGLPGQEISPPCRGLHDHKSFCHAHPIVRGPY